MRSAAAWMAAALVLVAVAGLYYLRPSLSEPAAARAAAATPAAGAGGEVLADVSFANPRLGSVTLARLVPRIEQFAYATSDGGATWRPGAHLDYLTPRLVVQQPDGGVGTFRVSTDGGRTSHAVLTPDPQALVPGPPQLIDATHGWWLLREPTATTLWHTDDGGRTWRSLPLSGVPSHDFLSQVTFLDPLRGVLVAARGNGTSALFVTGDGGRTWRLAATLTSPSPDSPQAGALLLARRGTLLAWLRTSSAVRNDPNQVTPTYLMLSSDGGQTWTAPRPGPEVQELTTPPVFDDRGRLLVLEERRLWVSADDGLTWTARVVQAPDGVVPVWLVVADGTLLAAASSGHPSGFSDAAGSVFAADTLLRSTDGGAHWDQVRLP